MTRNEITYNSIIKEIEKLETRLQRETARTEKRIEKAKTIGSYFSTFEEWVKVRDDKENPLSDNQYNALYIVGIEDRELKDISKNLERYYIKLANAEKILTEEQNKVEEIQVNKVKVIEDYLDNWEKEAISYYQEKGLIVSEHDGQPDTITLEDIRYERNRKSDYITYRVYSVVGKILDATRLYVANDGNLNGIIKGESGRCEVRTIRAGGYNIQCLHFRILINKLREV